MGCFACGDTSTQSEKTVLAMYKNAFNETGKAFWFYKKKNTNETFITGEEDFKQFKKANQKDFKKGLYEFAHIREFGES